MRILFITTWYPTKFNPVAGIFVREHAKAVNMFNKVVVLHSSTENLSFKGLYKIEQESDRDITEGIPTFRVWRKRIPIKTISYFIFIISILRGFKHILSSGFKPNIIHAHIYEAGVPAMLIGKLYRIPVVITEHFSAFPRKMLSSIEIFKAKKAFRNAKYVLPVSYALQKAIENYGIRANYRIIPNVIDTSVFYPSPKAKESNISKRILFVGLLVPIKGIPFLLQALNQLRKQRDDWHLDIVGDGPSRREYEQLATDLGLFEKITFHGFKNKIEVAELMRNADIFVLPSLWENFPCVIIEAMASGLPIVSTSIGGIPEIVNDEVGILVSPGKPDELLNAIAFMLEKLDEINPFDIAKKTREYRLEIVGKLLNSIYESSIKT